MPPFDHQPELGPLRPKHEVLPGVVRRGTILRRRRHVLIAAPAAAASLALVIVIALLTSSTSNQHVKTVPAGPPHTTTSVPGGQSSNRPGPDGSPASTGPGANPAVTDTAASADSNPPGDTASSPPPRGHVFGPCLPAGTQNNTTGDPRACYQASNGPKGNYTSVDPNARGCVVHNSGAYTVVATPSDFFCQYDATKPGGYTSDGPFNLLRIVRNGQTIDIDGMDPNTPRCQPTGFIQPGDHVYIDGRNDFGPGPVNPNGYTTTSVGDPFHC